MPEEPNNYKVPKVKRIAIYTRKSNDENLTNAVTSIDSQKSCCRSYIEIQKVNGWEECAETFDDPAESGKSLKRPAIQRLLKRIGEGKIDGVIVYKLDRLTRNSKDFHGLLEMFEKHDVAFISSTESIDTKSPQGRLMTAIMVQFAQYDRELDVMRSQDFHLARARKGLWTGGLPPLGYEVKDKLLIVNEKEAELVNRIFNMYVKYQSTIRVATELNQLGFKRKLYKTEAGKPFGGKTFDMDSVLRILQRKVYIGYVRNSRTKQEFPGQQKPIVDPSMFKQVQELLASKNHRGGEVHYGVNKHGVLLKGLIGCGECGNAIVPTFRYKNGKTYLYYRCLAKSNGMPHKCAVAPLGARKFESYVVENLAALGWDRAFLAGIVAKAQEKAKSCITPLDKEKRVLEGQLKKIQGELRQLVTLVKAGSASNEVAEEIQRLEESKKDLNGRIGKIEAQASHSQKAVYDVDAIQGALQRFAANINKLPVDLQVKAIRTLVEKITVFKDRVTIKVYEVPVVEVHNTVDEKWVLGGCALPEQQEPKTQNKQNTHRIGVGELSKKWRPLGDSNP